MEVLGRTAASVDSIYAPFSRIVVGSFMVLSTASRVRYILYALRMPFVLLFYSDSPKSSALAVDLSHPPTNQVPVAQPHLAAASRASSQPA